MSRIGVGECGNMDMEWYGVDKKGNVAVFCSGGEGNLPEFVCESEERADELIEYFDRMKKTTSSMLMFHKPRWGVQKKLQGISQTKGFIILMQMMAQN